MYQTWGHLGHQPDVEAHLQVLPEQYVLWRISFFFEEQRREYEGRRSWQATLERKIPWEVFQNMASHETTECNGEGLRLQRWQGRVFSVQCYSMKSKAKDEQILMQMSKLSSHHETHRSAMSDVLSYCLKNILPGGLTLKQTANSPLWASTNKRSPSR